jgi:DNA (cytosine-5)-methyltransferase 1
MDIPEQKRPPCHRGTYRGFSNVYGRMAWDQTAPTMTGGCTTLSKGRFGHPAELRTISVFEAALFQEFPPEYHLATPFMDKACEIIGNALPCGFATAMAAQVKKALSLYLA